MTGMMYHACRQSKSPRCEHGARERLAQGQQLLDGDHRGVEGVRPVSGGIAVETPLLHPVEPDPPRGLTSSCRTTGSHQKPSRRPEAGRRRTRTPMRKSESPRRRGRRETYVNTTIPGRLRNIGAASHITTGRKCAGPPAGADCGIFGGRGIRRSNSSSLVHLKSQVTTPLQYPSPDAVDEVSRLPR